MKLAVQWLMVILVFTPAHFNLRPLVRYLREPGGTHTISTPRQNIPVQMPVKTTGEMLQLGASSSLAVDVDTNTVLFTKNASERRPIASITKLVTAMVVLRDHQLSEVVTVPALPTYQSEDATMGLVAGQQFKLGDLLKAAMISSANDAADALAIADSGSKEAFGAKMNGLVSDWGISDAHFTNPTGLVDQDNYASADALAKIGKIALANTELRTLVATRSSQITSLNGQTFNLASTNQLLSDARFSGLKTGYTAAAGQSLVGLVDVHGHKVITVVLNSPDRFGETQALVNYLERTYTWL